MIKESNFSKLGYLAAGTISVFLIVWILIVGRPIILPFMIALFLTFILEPLVNLMRKVKIPLGLAVSLTLLLAFVLMYLLGALLYTNVQTFVNQLPAYEDRLANLLSGIVNDLESLIGQPITTEMFRGFNWLDALQSLSLASNLMTGVGTFVGFFVKMLLVIVFVAYMLMGRRNLTRKIYKAFPEEQASHIDDILNKITSKIQAYLGAKTVISLVTGFVAYVIFLFFGMDFAIFWAFVIFLFNFIPNIGSAIASILPVIFSILQFGSFGTALWLLVALSILQFIMGNIVEPRTMGYSLDLSPMIVILALVFWGYIWGVVGMLLSVPILATMAIVFERIEGLQFISVLLRGKV